MWHRMNEEQQQTSWIGSATKFVKKLVFQTGLFPGGNRSSSRCHSPSAEISFAPRREKPTPRIDFVVSKEANEVEEQEDDRECEEHDQEDEDDVGNESATIRNNGSDNHVRSGGLEPQAGTSNRKRTE